MLAVIDDPGPRGGAKLKPQQLSAGRTCQRCHLTLSHLTYLLEVELSSAATSRTSHKGQRSELHHRTHLGFLEKATRRRRRVRNITP